MNFIPFAGKIVIEPIKQDNMLVAEGNQFQEMGKVLAVGVGVKFVKKGDIVYFDSWGCSKTAEEDGTSYYIVPCNDKFILGKKNGPKQQRV